MTGVNIEQIGGISEPAAESGIVALQSCGPRLCVVAAQIEIFEEYELGIHAAGAIVRISRAARLFVGRHEADERARHQRLLDTDDRVVGIRIRTGLARLHVHHADIESGNVAGDFAADINRHFLPADWINPDLPRKKQQVLVPQQEIEYVRILQEKPPLLGNKDWKRREVELLLVNVRVREIGIERADRDQIAGQAIFDVAAAGVQGLPWLALEGLRAAQRIRLDNQQAAAFDAAQSTETAGLRDAPEAEDALVPGPFVFLILSANEAAEVDPPAYRRTAAKIQRAEWDLNRGG